MNNAPFARRRRILKSDMNVVPYIDVMLVLLVIFMATTSAITTGIDIELPREQMGKVESTDLPVIVSMDAQGLVFLSDVNHQDTPMDVTDLVAYLSQTSDAQVVIRADRALAYGQIMALMSQIQSAGVAQVGLISDPS